MKMPPVERQYYIMNIDDDKMRNTLMDLMQGDNLQKTYENLIQMAK